VAPCSRLERYRVVTVVIHLIYGVRLWLAAPDASRRTVEHILAGFPCDFGKPTTNARHGLLWKAPCTFDGRP
jgi:hypothetical protein